MAENPFYIAPPNILQALLAGGQAYNQGQDRQRDERNELAKLLMLKEDRAFRQQEAQRAQSNSDRSFGLQREAFTRREKPEGVRTLEAAGIDPASPEGRKALFPKTDTPISATDKKIIVDAENDIPRLDATIANVKRAMELNPKVFTGFGASLRGQIGASLPAGITSTHIAPREGAEATAEWDQVMGQEAIKNMSETLKGASTDFEMKKFLGIAADTSKPANVRQNAMQRFLSLAEAERSLRVNRAKELRGGTFFKPGGGATSAPASGDALSAAKAAIERGAPREAVIQRLRDNGIDPSGL